MARGVNQNGSVHPTRIFKTEDDMHAAWENYKKHVREVEDAKWLKVQYVGKDGDRATDKLKVPYTLEGFQRYCRSVAKIGVIDQYFQNQDGYYDEFIAICRAIRDEIREDQIVGGLLGVYNPSITQRLNGLADKKEVENSGNIVLQVPAEGEGLGE